MAAASDYFALGRDMGNQRRSDVAMNTPVVRDEERLNTRGDEICSLRAIVGEGVGVGR